MESRINKLANITGNGPQRPSETTWSLPIMMLRNWKSVFLAIKKSNAGLFKQMRRCPRNNPLFLFSLNWIVFCHFFHKMNLVIFAAKVNRYKVSCV